MSEVVIFAVGSPLVVDYEETIRRAGLVLRAGISNHPGPSFLLGDAPVVAVDAVPGELLPLPFLVPLFTPGNRQSASLQAERLGFTTPGLLVDPTAIVPARMALGEGCYVNAGCSLGGGASYGRYVLINRGASVGHHANIGDFVSIGPAAAIAGQVTIETGVAIGAGAVILPKITVGSNAVVGAGAVVTNDVAQNTVVVGNPARPVKEVAGYGGAAVV